MSRTIKRNTFTWILAFSLVFSSVGIVSAASSNDVKGHWAEDTITNWVDKGFVVGYEDGTIRPDATINRQEFITLVNRSFGLTERVNFEFIDLNPTDWAYPEVSKARAAGYISGYQDGTFRATKEISRQEAAVIIYHLLDLKISTSAELFTDAHNSPKWSKGAIGAIKDLGIMGGYEDGKFRPVQVLTRAEAIVVIDRAFLAKDKVQE